MESKPFKLGLDIHGICDANPEFFSLLSKLFVDAGHEVIVITGRMASQGGKEELERLGISYTKYYSIIDYNVRKGKKVTYDENNDPWIDDETWNNTKAEICKEEGIDFHIDDSSRYGDLFSTPYGMMKIDMKR